MAATAPAVPAQRPAPLPAPSPRPGRRFVRGLVFGALAAGAVVLGRTSGVLDGAAGLLVTALLVLSVPTSRDLCRRVLLAGCLLLGWTPLLWWWDLPVGTVGRATIGLAVLAGALAGWVGAGVRPTARALRLVPRPRAVDLLVPASAGLGLVVLQPWLQAKSATQVLGVLMGGWDNVAHFSMVHMIRRFGVTVDRLPAPPTGGTWQFAGYPQGFHAVIATIIEVMIGPVRGDLATELLAYSRAVALLVVIVVAVLVAGFCALPALRGRPALALPAATFVAAVFYLGPGADLIQGGIGNFTLACALVVAIALLAVRTPRVLSPVPLAAVAGAVVGVATSWVLLLTLAAPALLVLVVPFRRARWRAAPGRVAVAVALVLVVVGCLVRTAIVLTRVQAASPLTVTSGVVPLDAGVLLVSVLGTVGACLLVGRGSTDAAVRARVAALVFVPLVGAGVAGALIALQVATNGVVGYYGFKFMNGLLIVALVLVVIPLAHLAPRVPRARAGVLATGRTVVASTVVTLALTQAFGFTFDASAVRVPAEAPGVRNQLRDAEVVRSPPSVADLPVRLERAARLRPGGLPEHGYYLDLAPSGRVDPILVAQWYLALTDTWTSAANALAAGVPDTREVGPDVLADARWVLLTSPDTVVLVPREYRSTIVDALDRPDWDARVIGI